MQVGVAISHTSIPNFCCCPIFVNIPGKFETHSNKIRHPQPPNPNFCCTALIDKSEDSNFRRVFRLFQNLYIFKTLIISLFLFLFLLLLLFRFLYFFFFQSLFFCFFFSPNFISLFFFLLSPNYSYIVLTIPLS